MAKITFLVVVSILVALCCVPCVADPYVTGVYWPSPGGYCVELTIHNTLSASSVWGLKMDSADVIDPWGPSEWVIYQDSREVEWSATTEDACIEPGQELSGFGFATLKEPSALDYLILANNGYGGYVTLVFVPEPTSLLALAAGLGGLALWRRRR